MLAEVVSAYAAQQLVRALRDDVAARIDITGHGVGGAFVREWDDAAEAHYNCVVEGVEI